MRNPLLPSIYKHPHENATSTNATSTNATRSASSQKPTSTSPPGCQETTKIPDFMGVRWSTHCGFDLDKHDYDNGPASSAAECVETCNRRAGCFGATWTPSDQHCYRKVSGVSVNDLVANNNSPGIVSFLPDLSGRNQTGKDIACPFPNLSSYQTKLGLPFEILCGSTLWYDDIYSPATDNNTWMHADSLQECLENCANHQPLCSRVTYDADHMINLWSNCWLKIATSQAKPVTAVGGMRHSAFAVLPSLEPVACKNDTERRMQDGRVFKMSCLDRRVLNDTHVPPRSSSHALSIDDCLGACSSAGPNCSAVAFDVGLQSGYRNCYLFDAIPPSQDQQSNYTFIYWNALSSQYQAPISSISTSMTKGVIAASVVIPCGLSLVLFAIYWFWWTPRSDRKYTPVKGD